MQVCAPHEATEPTNGGCLSWRLLCSGDDCSEMTGTKTDSYPNTLSVIIPALNEAEWIGAVLESLYRGCANTEYPPEVIVVDGGSVDGTPQLAADYGAKVLQSNPGRAIQMNAGAKVASGSILLFLHADTLVPFGYDDDIRKVIDTPGVAGGAFLFSISDAEPLSLQIITRFANLRSRYFHFPYGDQAIFLYRESFIEIGGYPEIPIMEDFEMVRRLRRRGRIGIIPKSIQTSGRRWSKIGIWRTTLINQFIVGGYLLGISPRRLASWYGRM